MVEILFYTVLYLKDASNFNINFLVHVSLRQQLTVFFVVVWVLHWLC